MLRLMRACPECLAVFLADPEFCSFDGTKLRSGDDALKGSEVAGHRIDALLGLGGTGCVFSGTRIDGGQRVAIKVLFGEMASDKSIAQRFEREAKAMSSIRHRNVVAIHDYGTLKNGLVYLIMELLDGITLRERIEQSAPLTSDHAGRILEELTSGLAEAHRLGYVHRDLKPGNVILTGPFGKEQVKILDFGIVASLREGKDKERLTKTGYIIGTPTYMAPEQVDPSAITPQVDVYALGVILYEMLTGDAPFNGTLEQILVAKMTTAPKPIPDSGLLGELVLRMLAMEPEDRPPSALHVSAELSRLSLLTDDPATVRADAPQLGLWTPPDDDGGVRIIDRTDENEVVVTPVEEGPGDPWVSDTRKVDVVDAALLEFSDVSTRESFGQRTDTVIETVDHNDTFDGIPDAAKIPESLEADTGEDEAPENVPTRITERPEELVFPYKTDENETEDTPGLNEATFDEQHPPFTQTDDAGDADTALDMRIDHLLDGVAPRVEPVEDPRSKTGTALLDDMPPIVTPVASISSSEKVPQQITAPLDRGEGRSRRFFWVGIALAVLLGVAAAMVIILVTNETVLVDARPDDP